MDWVSSGVFRLRRTPFGARAAGDGHRGQLYARVSLGIQSGFHYLRRRHDEIDAEF